MGRLALHLLKSEEGSICKSAAEVIKKIGQTLVRSSCQEEDKVTRNLSSVVG